MHGLSFRPSFFLDRLFIGFHIAFAAFINTKHIRNIHQRVSTSQLVDFRFSDMSTPPILNILLFGLLLLLLLPPTPVPLLQM